MMKAPLHHTVLELVRKKLSITIYNQRMCIYDSIFELYIVLWGAMSYFFGHATLLLVTYMW